MTFIRSSNPTTALPAVLAAVCTAALATTTLADRQPEKANSVIASQMGEMSKEDGAGIIQNFESFNLGAGCGQQGWTGFCGAGPPPVGFQITDEPQPEFATRSVRHVSDGSNIAGFEVVSPIQNPIETGVVAADIVISNTASLYQFVPVNTIAAFFNTRINFEANGNITALQIAGSPPCTTGTFAATTGTWSPNTLMRIAVRVPGDGTLQVFKDGVQIFNGHDIAQFCGGTTHGINQVRIFASNATGTAQTSFMIMDNLSDQIGGLPACQQPLPSCRADVAPPGGNGTVDVNDLLAVINTWGQNGNPNGPRPQGDCDPLPNGDCLVNVNDLLTVINAWGNCPQPMGACCLPNGNCLANQTQAQCTAAGGSGWFLNQTCAQANCQPTPVNDECAGALTLGNGVHNITNANATTSTAPGGACAGGGAVNFQKDVWYNYTATCTGNLVINTCATSGSVTDTVLAVYTGACGSLTEVGCNDDSDVCASGSLMSRVVVSATTGTVYRIRVGSWQNTATGPIVLNISCTAFNNDFCAEATTVAIPSTTNGTLLTASQDQAPGCNGVGAAIGRWYTLTGNGNTLTVSTCTSPAGFWDARLSVYCGVSCSNLVCVNAANADSCNGTQETVSFCSANGQQYWILVHTDDPAGQGQFVLTVANGAACGNPVQCVAPGDFCASAIDVTANINGAPVNGDNTNMTPPNGGPADTDLPAGSPTCHWAGTPTATFGTAWYKLTAPANGLLSVSTCNSTLPFRDSVIALYSGACGSLTQVACGEDTCAGTLYYSNFDATGLTPGATYYLMVGNPGGDVNSVQGPYVVNITSAAPCSLTCPGGATQEGEACLTAPPDSTNGGCNSTPTVYSTITVNGSVICGVASTYLNGTTQTRDTDWYRFVAPASGTYRIEINAEFTALTGFVTGVGTPGGACTAPAFVTGSTLTTQGNCTVQTSPAVTLTGGQAYAVFVGPSVFTGFPCGTRNDYTVRLISP